MDASIKDTIRASDKEAEYDDKVKKILGHKIILAHILVSTVEEFRGMNPKDVVNYIEGEPYISVTPVNPASIIRVSGSYFLHRLWYKLLLLPFVHELRSEFYFALF